MGLDRLAGKTRTWYTEHSRRLRGSGKIIIATPKWSLTCAIRRIPITDWVTHCRTSQKLHLNPFLKYSTTSMSGSMSCNVGAHALLTADVFWSILTKTGWGIVDYADFYRFSLWFHLKFPVRNNCTLPMLFLVIVLHECTFSFNPKRNHPRVKDLHCLALRSIHSLKVALSWF